MYKLLNLFKSNEHKLERLTSLQNDLLQLQAEKELVIDNYQTINKAISCDEFTCKDDIQRGNKYESEHIRMLADFKFRERKLNNEITFLKSLNSVAKTLSVENKIKALDLIKSLHKEGKIALETYNKVLGSKTDKGQTKYADIIVINNKGEILLLKRSIWEDAHKGAWVIPGGHVDSGEDDETAAKRELREESGICVDKLLTNNALNTIHWGLGGKYEDKNAHISYYLLSGVDTKDFEIVLDESETRDYLWVKREEIGNYPMIFNMADNVKRVLGWDEYPQITVIRKAVKEGLIPIEKVPDIVKSIEKLKGGRADGKSIDEIAMHHGVSVSDLEDEFSIGLKIEMEHTNDKTVAAEIAKDHLWEIADYYTRLKRMEAEAAEEDDISKSYLQGDLSDDEYEELTRIEKAKRDISKLKRIRKMVLRGGKLFLQTFYVKTGETVEEELDDIYSEDAASRLASDIEVQSGKKYLITTKRKESEGTLVDIYLDKKTGVRWLVLVDENGIESMCAFTAITKIEEISVSGSKPRDEESLPEYEDLSYVRGLGGSSNVRLYKDNDGKLFAVKQARDRDSGVSQLQDELAADEIYRIMGALSPKSYLSGGKYKVSEFIIGHELSYAWSWEDKVSDEKLADLSAESLYKKVSEHFVLDCLLANWDVIGANKDNILVDKDGNVYRIDNGSALRHRARGALKGDFFKDDVTELDTMRDPSKNPDAIDVYKSVTEEDIKSQIADIIEKKKDILEIVDSLGDDNLSAKMRKRIDSLEKRLGERKKAEEPGKAKKKLRADMPSLVTQNYFDDGWDDFVLEGIVGIKDKIKQRILAVERYNDSEYESYAREAGLSVEEYKARCQQLIEQIISKSDFYRATHCSSGSVIRGWSNNALDAVLNKDGRFKSQFETDRSDGCMDPSYRSGTEHEFFGFDDNIEKNKDKRPIYGYWSTDRKNGVLNSSGTIPPPNSVSGYGETIVKIKRESALKKATITFADSLGKGFNFTPTPAVKPHFTSLSPTSLSTLERWANSKDGVTTAHYDSYVEAQYHNQLTVEDIESIHLSTEQYREEFSDTTKAFSMLSKTAESVTNYIANSGNKDMKLIIF